MLDAVIRFSLANRPLVLLVALAVVAFGSYRLTRMPVDVFPDLNRPTVTVMTEAPGLAPEEVEVLVTRPLEYLLNGTTGVTRVRSASGIGLSIVWVEFDWGTDIYRDRQIVAEKLVLAQERLPEEARPTLAPISSIMGEIRLLGLRAKDPPDSQAGREAMAMTLRTTGEFAVRNRLLAIEGVSQVTVMGGRLKQYQVLTSPERLAAEGVSLAELTDAAAKANVLAGGGLIEREQQETLVRISGQSRSIETIADSAVLWRDPRPVLIKDVADVRLGGPVRRGDGSVTVRDRGVVAGEAVILAVQKQPQADTLALDRDIEAALDELEPTLPGGVVIERRIFKQADFIEAAVANVVEAVRDGAIWVVVVLFLFMANFRVSVSSLTSMPVSILLTVLVFWWFGLSINTLTLGGIAVAIGDLVDDSIVDIENIARRLKENRQSARPAPPLEVVFRASSEVRNSIVYATLIVTLVVLPLFALDGIEGRMFAPLGIAYIVSLLSSLAVSLTVTPVLGSYLLPGARFLERAREPLLVRGLKWLTERLLRVTLGHSLAVLVLVGALVSLSLASLAWMDGEFLPTLNEGTVTVNIQAEPGTGLDESDRIAGRVEALLIDVPEVTSVSRRTGRAELDEHAEGVNVSELDVSLAPAERLRPGPLYAALRMVPVAHLWAYDRQGRDREAVLADIRDRVTRLPGVRVNVGQPISHRIDHLMTGVRAQIAIKVFGPDLYELRAIAADVQARIEDVPGLVDLQVEPQVEIPQLRIEVRHAEAARHGLAPGDIARMLETAYRGRTVSQVLEGEQTFDLVVWFDEESRRDPVEIGKTILETPSGRKVALADVAAVTSTTGPNTINHEDVRRRIVVSANVEGRGLAGVVAAIRERLAPVEADLARRPGSYDLVLGGQFEAQQAATVRLLVLGALSVVGIAILLRTALRSWSAAVQVLINIPLAAIGAIVALLLTNWPDPAALAAAPWWQWPAVWIGATNLSLAHGVGFITLIGIVSRNGIMMISHYLHLMEVEGEPFGPAMIIRGSLERLTPVLMTALTSFIGLLPLLFGAGQTGKEILYPLSVVVFGGMLASTLLDQIVTPALFLRFGRHLGERPAPPAGPTAPSTSEGAPGGPAAPGPSAVGDGVRADNRSAVVEAAPTLVTAGEAGT